MIVRAEKAVKAKSSLVRRMVCSDCPQDPLLQLLRFASSPFVSREVSISIKVLRFTQNQRSAAQLDGFIDIVDNEKRSFAGFADEVEKVLA